MNCQYHLQNIDEDYAKMKGDRIVICKEAIKTATEIIDRILPRINQSRRRFILSIAGESGSGKTVLSKAINQQLGVKKIRSIVLCLDDYFVLPPQSNDQKRRKDPEWLGPHMEVRLDVLDNNLQDASKGKNEIEKPLVDYYANLIETEKVSLDGIKVVIAEGTYVSLLRNVDVRIFIEKSWQETLENRFYRSRGREAGDPFIENVLAMEHKIIAGHRQLADFIVAHDDSVIEFKRLSTDDSKE